jgi:hypothetical protein
MYVMLNLSADKVIYRSDSFDSHCCYLNELSPEFGGVPVFTFQSGYVPHLVQFFEYDCIGFVEACELGSVFTGLVVLLNWKQSHESGLREKEPKIPAPVPK